MAAKMCDDSHAKTKRNTMPKIQGTTTFVVSGFVMARAGGRATAKGL